MGWLFTKPGKRSPLAAFKLGDIALAHGADATDSEADRLEVQADTEIVKLIASRGPVGTDLRLVIVVSKSVSNLELIGDEAVRITGLVIRRSAKKNITLNSSR